MSHHALAQESRRSPVSWRAVLLGLAGVTFVSVLTPFNNYVLDNSDLVGCYLPTAVLLFIGLLVLVVNPMLGERRRFGRGELAVIMAMMMMACAIPAGGLMRYLPGNITAVYRMSADNVEFERMLRTMDLPDWIFPRFDTDDIQRRGNEQVISGFAGRIPSDGTFADRFHNVPWGRWLVPAITWGAFLLSLYFSIVSLVLIFRRQWMENERLPFPIASVLSSLIEAPDPGRRLNSLFCSRLFWWAFAIVFVLHGFNALSLYFPRWPAIPLKFDVSKILADPPVSAVSTFAKTQTIYFGVIGIACLIESRLSLSLWLFFVLIQVAQIMYGKYQSSLTEVMQNDQFLGGLVPYTLAAIWVARHHLQTVIRQMFHGAKSGEPRGRYLPYSIAAWTYVVCMAVQVTWLMAVGCSLSGAIVLVLMIGMILFALVRMIAESGLLYLSFTLNLNTPWQFAATQLPQAIATRTNLTSNFFGNLFTGMLTHDVRQSVAVLSSTGVAVADKEYEQEKNARHAVPFVACIVGSLVLAFVLAGASTLYVEYSYAATIDRKGASPINSWGAEDQARWWVMWPSTQYIPPQDGPRYNHNRWAHLSFGAGLTAALSWGRLTFPNFPLHPLGYLLALTLGVNWVWFSILLGWMLKASILKLGGAALYRELKPLALGLILGEVAAAGFWLVLNLVLVVLDLPYASVHILLT